MNLASLMMPPPLVAVLPLRAESVRVSVPPLPMPPPEPKAPEAELPDRVLLLTVSVPPL